MAAAHYVFLTLPGYSFLDLTSAIEVLSLANRVSQRSCYEWTIAKMDGKPVRSSNGMDLPATVELSDLKAADIVWVCGGDSVHNSVTPQTIRVLRQIAMQYPLLGGLGTGSYALAAAGLLVQHQAAIHWDHRFAAQELFPQVHFAEKLYVIDRNRYTAAGGTAPMHLMLKLVKDHLGEAISVAVSERLNLERIRDGQDRQFIHMLTRVGHFHAQLIEVGELMQANIEEPLSMNEICNLVGVSRRQLERLFKRYVGEMPTRYYMDLRLQHARELILQTAMPIIEVAVACGFVNGPYFSRCYQDKFGVRPSGERSGTPRDARAAALALI